MKCRTLAPPICKSIRRDRRKQYRRNPPAHERIKSSGCCAISSLRTAKKPHPMLAPMDNPSSHRALCFILDAWVFSSVYRSVTRYRQLMVSDPQTTRPTAIFGALTPQSRGVHTYRLIRALFVVGALSRMALT